MASSSRTTICFRVSYAPHVLVSSVFLQRVAANVCVQLLFYKFLFPSFVDCGVLGT